MLCRRSASLISTTPMSSTIARNILRRFSAWCAFSREPAPSPSSAVQGMRPSLVTPSTSRATRAPNSDSTRSSVIGVSSMTSWSKRRGDRFGVELHSRQNGRHGDRVNDVGLAGLPHFPAMGIDRKLRGSRNEIDVRGRSGLADRLEECIERSADFGWQRVVCCCSSTAGSATVSVGGSTGARSAASERLGDIAVGAFRDRSKFLGRSSVATVEKSRLGVNELAVDSDNGAVRLGAT